MPETQPGLTVQRSSLSIQRKCTKCEEESKRQPSLDEEAKIIQAKPSNTSAAPQVSAGLESYLNTSRGTGQQLPPSSRAYFEPRFGRDLSDVRVHSDGQASQAANSISAKAVTAGKNIVFGAGQYSPQTHQGQTLLAHELTHVIQQDQDNRSPSLQRTCGEASIKAKTRGHAGCADNFDGEFLSGHKLFRFDINCDDFAQNEDEALISFVAALPSTATFEIHGFANTDAKQSFNEDLGCARARKAFSLITTPKKGFKGILASRITSVVNHGPVSSGTNPVADLRSVVIKVAESPDLILPKPETPKTPVGPKPGPGAPAGFCQPFLKITDAIQALGRVKIALAVLLTGSLDDPDVAALWDTYISTAKKGTKGTLPARKVFSNRSTKLVQQFESDPETVQQRKRLMKLLGDKVPKAGLVPGPVGSPTKPLPLRTVLVDADLLDLPMSFKDPTKRIPGLIAGGAGKNASDAGDDVRNVDGKFVVTNLGSGTFRLAAAFTFDVFDAIDFCPGNPGGFFAQLIITKDMSQLEATPDFPTYDTPFEVIYTVIDDEVI